MLFMRTASAADIVVRPNGPIRTLTQALKTARAGDCIIVHPGVYREGTIVVDKSVEISGIDYPVFDGEGQGTVLRVRANNVIIRGLEVANVGVSYVEDHAGIKLEDAHGCLLEGNRLRNTFFGIYLARSSNTRIVGNEISGEGMREASSGNAIHLWYCKNIHIESNHIRGHRDGIYLEWVVNSTIEGNISEDNLRYGLHFMFSDSSTYWKNTFRRNNAGVAVMYTKNVRMVQNRMEHNWGPVAYGLLLKDITDSHIAQNHFSRNTVGLYSEGSSRILIERNEFTQNGWAVRIMANSLENRFVRNNFIANSFDVATNSRHAFSTFEENYWSDYRGYDLTGDGYGDVPFRPVRLFSYLVERHPPTLILLRSFFIDLLDLAERILPTLTPESLVDPRPAMKAVR
jgi:nitrous oxidase accessory protein